MIPALTLSGEYEEIEELDDLIKQYHQAELNRSSKLEDLQEDIIKRVFQHNYNLDMNISEKEIRNDYNSFINKLHSYVEELKSSVIKDGLHILGEAASGDRLISLIHTLLIVE